MKKNKKNDETMSYSELDSITTDVVRNIHAISEKLAKEALGASTGMDDSVAIIEARGTLERLIMVGNFLIRVGNSNNIKPG